MKTKEMIVKTLADKRRKGIQEMLTKAAIRFLKEQPDEDVLFGSIADIFDKYAAGVLSASMEVRSVIEE